MLKRTVTVMNPHHISARMEQLIFSAKDEGGEKQVPVEDLGYLILDLPHTTITQAAFQLLSKHNVGVVFSDEKHMPTAMLFHLDTHHIQTERFRKQIEASEPLKKQLWAQTVRAKILNQAAVLERYGANEYKLLKNIATDVLSGDTSNREGQAARIYWSALFGEDFNRERFGQWPNAALNYGYAIIRACVARALAGSGLLPTLGIFHSNKYNSFVLADDIMEPYRPYVDAIVRFTIYPSDEDGKVAQELTKEHKQIFFEMLTQDVVMEEQVRPLMNAVMATTASLAKCFEGNGKKVLYPEM
jgi:CRISPR-associated protein Cas1